MTAAKFFWQQGERTSSDLDDVLCTISMPVVYIHNQILHQFKRNQHFNRRFARFSLFWWNWCPVCPWPLRIAAARPLLAFFSCAIPPSAMTTPRVGDAEIWNICLRHIHSNMPPMFIWYQSHILSICVLSCKYALYQWFHVICSYSLMPWRQCRFR